MDAFIFFFRSFWFLFSVAAATGISYVTMALLSHVFLGMSFSEAVRIPHPSFFQVAPIAIPAAFVWLMALMFIDWLPAKIFGGVSFEEYRTAGID